MLNKAEDKKTLIFFGILKNEFEHIKGNWFVLLLCFFISRQSIIGEIFPFAIVALCSYCYIKKPSFTVLLTTMIGILSVKLDFVYIVMLLAIYLFFYNFKNDEKKPATLISIYAACVLFFSKTSILLFEDFSLNSLLLNLFEAIFVFSSIALINEGYELVKKINLNRKKGALHRPQKTKIKQDFNGVEIAATSSTSSTSHRSILNKKVSLDLGSSPNKAPSFDSSYEKSSENEVLKVLKNKKNILNGVRSKKALNIFSDKAKKKIKEQLLWQNINLKFFEVMPEEEDKICLSFTVKSDKTSKESIEAITLIVRNLCGVRIKCTEKVVVAKNYYVLKFKSIKKVKVKTYTATATKDGSEVSGDSYAHASRSDKYYIVLCDGIGSGEEAYSESNGAVGMLSRFLYTDFTEDQILKTLNSLLLLKFDEERYVTFDLQIIDYSLKEVRLYKAGASPSYILSGGTVEKIESHSLPMGILENFEYNVFKRVVRKDDVIIMVSDGIIDSINLDSKKSLDKYLELIAHDDPQTLANSILSYALRGQSKIIDDMTVLVTKIG
ncbi:MAG: spoIIE [Bacillota bacterium]|nr:spoIIE [Bacillota bacterium]